MPLSLIHGPSSRRALTLAALTAVALLAGAGVAAAHVTVNPSAATAGDEAIALTFRVPNESASAGTVGITISFPTDHPFADVAVKEVPGWTVTPTKQALPTPVTEGNITIKEAVTSVSWTAKPGTMIAPGQFAEFEISAGPVPEADSLQFPTTQTYDDGTVVQWNEPTPASGDEPEYPVPTLTIAAAGDASGTPTAPSSSNEGSAAASDVQATVTSSADAVAATTSDSTALVLAVIGIVVAAAALVVAALALRRRSITDAPPRA